MTRVVVVEPKRGGRLAFKGFLISFIIAVIFALGDTSNERREAAGTAMAFGVGAAYIITNLRKWKRQNEIIRGGGIAWTVAGFLLILCLGGVIRVVSTVTSGSASSTAVDPKAVLLRDVKLKFEWSKEGFGSVMIADFTVRNPTQYRFKDFEIKCTHSAPSGTVIDSNTQTVYRVVEPKSTEVVRQMNMGFIHSQAYQSSCEMIDLTLLP